MASKADIANNTQLPIYAPSGGGPSITHTNPQGFRTEFACMYIYGADKIRCLNFPQAEIDKIRDILQSVWPRGIQNLRPYGMSQEIKLHGYPWKSWTSGRGLIEGRKTFCGLLQELFNIGWVLTEATNLCRGCLEKGMLLLMEFVKPSSS